MADALNAALKAMANDVAIKYHMKADPAREE
jgi:hypothetical protein